MTVRTKLALLEAGKQSDTLWIWLPPSKSSIEDFIEHGFLAHLRQTPLVVDVLFVQLEYQHVMEQVAVALLYEQVVTAQQAGYRQIWLAGISLGAFNALDYIAHYPNHISHLLLIAPYVGTGDILCEIRQSGGPFSWAKVADIGQDNTKFWWHYFALAAQKRVWPCAIACLTGREDRFWQGQELLMQILPDTDVMIQAGGHDWVTWKKLWYEWLNKAKQHA